jgi:nucleotide-binding universal stress UspA family protein
MIQFRHILVPTDFGASSERALEVAVDLANKYGSTMVLFHVYEVPALVYDGMTVSPVDLLTPIREAAERQFDEALTRLRMRVPRAKGFLTLGAPWQEILRVVADEGVDLIVMGTHGRRGIHHALMGSVAEKVVRMSPVPVLTVRSALEEKKVEGVARITSPAHA